MNHHEPLSLSDESVAVKKAIGFLPFEVTPISFRLTRHADPALAAAPAITGAGPAITAQTAATGGNTRSVHNQQ